jgi:hypothetical protein
VRKCRLLAIVGLALLATTAMALAAVAPSERQPARDRLLARAEQRAYSKVPAVSYTRQVSSRCARNRAGPRSSAGLGGRDRGALFTYVVGRFKAPIHRRRNVLLTYAYPWSGWYRSGAGDPLAGSLTKRAFARRGYPFESGRGRTGSAEA